MKPIIPALALATFSTVASQAAVMFSDDFDTNVNGPVVISGDIPNTTIIDSTSVPALGAGRGNVAAVDISAGGEWGGFNVPGPGQGTPLSLPAGTVAGVDSYTMKMDVFIPGATTAGTGDSIGFYMRLNGTTPDFGPGGNVRNFTFIDNVANQDSWFTIETTITIPEFNNSNFSGTESDTTPVTSLHPLWSVRDASNDGGAGVFAYVDNLSISATESIPEPNAAILGLIGALALIRRRR